MPRPGFSAVNAHDTATSDPRTKFGTVVVTVGTTAGSKVRFTLNGLQPAVPGRSHEADRIILGFPESAAHATAIGNTDDMVLAFL